MVVCHCSAISDQEIRAEIRAGVIDAASLAARCGAGARCGGCQPMIDALLAERSVSIRPSYVAA